MSVIYFLITFGISSLIGYSLIKIIPKISTFNTITKVNLFKSFLTGVFFAPSVTVVPASHLAGIYVIPANLKLSMSLLAGHLQSTLLLGILPVLIVSFCTLLVLNSRTTGV